MFSAIKRVLGFKKQVELSPEMTRTLREITKTWDGNLSYLIVGLKELFSPDVTWKLKLNATLTVAWDGKELHDEHIDIPRLEDDIQYVCNVLYAYRGFTVEMRKQKQNYIVLLTDVEDNVEMLAVDSCDVNVMMVIDNWLDGGEK